MRERIGFRVGEISRKSGCAGGRYSRMSLRWLLIYMFIDMEGATKVTCAGSSTTLPVQLVKT